jgi:predicted flap endonuclease-1-like 5' DNA nuclease
MGWGFVLVEMLVWALLFAALGLLVGYLLWYRRGKRLQAALEEREQRIVELDHERRAAVAERDELSGTVEHQRSAAVAADRRAKAAAAELAAANGRLGEVESRLNVESTLELEHAERIAELERELATARARNAGLEVELKASSERQTALEMRVGALDAEAAKVAQLERSLAELRTQGTPTEIDLRDGDHDRDGGDATVRPFATAPSGTSPAGASGTAAATATAATTSASSTSSPAAMASSAASTADAPAFDAAAASAAFGKKVKLDDLKLVEGIGPKIEELLHADGIRTWRALADVPVGRLDDILRRAGDRFAMHDPATWPRQSSLAAEGKFAELAELQERLSGGRS